MNRPDAPIEAAEAGTVRKLLDDILEAEAAYDRALDQDFGGEHLHGAYTAIWDAIDRARLALARASSPQTKEGET